MGVSLIEEYLVPGGRYLVNLACDDANDSAVLKRAAVRIWDLGSPGMTPKEPAVIVSYPFDVVVPQALPGVSVKTDVSVLDDATLRVAVVYPIGSIPGRIS
jgi:hypothetical protein